MCQKCVWRSKETEKKTKIKKQSINKITREVNSRVIKGIKNQF